MYLQSSCNFLNSCFISFQDYQQQSRPPSADSIKKPRYSTKKNHFSAQTPAEWSLSPKTSPKSVMGLSHIDTESPKSKSVIGLSRLPDSSDSACSSPRSSRSSKSMNGINRSPVKQQNAGTQTPSRLSRDRRERDRDRERDRYQSASRKTTGTQTDPPPPSPPRKQDSSSPSSRASPSGSVPRPPSRESSRPAHQLDNSLEQPVTAAKSSSHKAVVQPVQRSSNMYCNDTTPAETTKQNTLDSESSTNTVKCKNCGVLQPASRRFMFPEPKEKKVIKCDVCHDRFRTAAQLENHLKSHTKPYICAKCRQGFSFESAWMRHERFCKHTQTNHDDDEVDDVFES